MGDVITSYKGFDKDLKCHGFQYEVGKEYEEPDAKACEKGFHACEMPLDVLRYYEPGKQSRYCVVEQSGVISKHNEDSKVASSKIKIGAEIGIPGLVKAQIEYVREKTEPSGKHHSTGSWSANSATGDWSANSATGYGSANISTGIECSNNAAGEKNIAVAWGKDNKCKGAIGCFLVLSEWGNWDGHKYPFIGVKMVEVDGKTYKPDTWYTLKNGEIVEVE
jgi:hypothetical protein